MGGKKMCALTREIMMNEQEMQFADPDWQPRGSWSRPQENTAASSPPVQPVTSNIPYDVSQDAGPLSYEQGYRASAHRQSIPYVSPVAQQGPGRQVSGTRRRSFWWVWMIVIIIVISMFSGMSRSFNRSVGFPTYQRPNPAQTYNYALNGASHLSISDSSGSVTVQVVDTKTSVITIQPDDRTQPEISYAADVMTITIDASEGVVVTVPEKVALDLQINAGSVEVDGFSGQLSAQTDFGSIALNQDSLDGQSTITSRSGDIRLDQTTLSGNATIQTGNAGNIDFTGSLDTTGTYQFFTDSGDITLHLPSDSALRVSPTQNSGTYQSDFANPTGSGPQAALTVRTDSGHIQIHRN
jgi:hypothetical protein